MGQNKKDIIAQLQKDILSLQGYKHAALSPVKTELGPIRYAFPNAQFPIGAMHEFICPSLESKSASTGFICSILSSLMRKGGVSLWIGSAINIYAPALKQFDIEPDKIIFIRLKKDKDVLWCMEEALKCEGLSSVVGEMKELDFTTSRRFQLAVEQSRVTGFILRTKESINTTACVTRWKITSIPSISEDDLPGVGFPVWDIALIKVRNGKPGNWQLEWRKGKLRTVNEVFEINQGLRKKTG